MQQVRPRPRRPVKSWWRQGSFNLNVCDLQLIEVSKTPMALIRSGAT